MIWQKRCVKQSENLGVCSRMRLIDVDSLDILGYLEEFPVGETVEVENFDQNRWNECAPGIHHYITRWEAVNHG